MPQKVHEIAVDDINPIVYMSGSFRHTLHTPNNEAFKNTDSYRFMVMVDGAAELILNGEQCKIQSNDILYLTPGQSYAILNRHGEFQVINIYFDFEKYRPANSVRYSTLLDKDYDENASGDIFHFTDCEIFNTARLMKSELTAVDELVEIDKGYQRHDRFYRKQASMKLGECLIGFAQRERNPAENSNSQSMRNCELILDYINKNFHGKLDSTELSAISGYHPYHINRLVKSVTGMTLHHYVMRVKVKQSAILLRETDLSVTEIAQYLAFSDASHFSTVFRKFYGVSPVNYKTEHASGNA